MYPSLSRGQVQHIEELVCDYLVTYQQHGTVAERSDPLQSAMHAILDYVDDIAGDAEHNGYDNGYYTAEMNQ